LIAYNFKDNNIFEAENVFSKVECNSMIELFEKDKSEKPDSTVADDGIVDKSHSARRSSSIIFTESKEKDWVDKWDGIVYNQLNNLIFQYCRYYQIVNDFFEYDSGYEIHKYKHDFKPGVHGEYPWHSDFISINGRDKSQIGERHITCITYLNDDYNGGETEFKFGEKIVPKTGMTTLFPSYWTHTHRGCEVTKGNKYILLTWFVNGFK